MSELRPSHVITGPGRCGTKLVARLLTAAGIPTTHEGYYNHGHWEREPVAHPGGDSSWMAAPILASLPEVERPPTIALLRGPAACTASFTAIGFYTPAAIAWNACHQVVRRFHPEVYEWERPADRALAHWCAFTDQALQLARRVYRLEDLHLEAFDHIVTWAAYAARCTPRMPEGVAEVWERVTAVNQNPLEYDRERWGQPYPGWLSHPRELRQRACEIALRAGYEGVA